VVNRVMASKVTDYGVRIEFDMPRNALPERQIEAAESLTFACEGLTRRQV
jgi:hypothetical protein